MSECVSECKLYAINHGSKIEICKTHIYQISYTNDNGAIGVYS